MKKKQFSSAYRATGERRRVYGYALPRAYANLNPGLMFIILMMCIR